MLLYILTYLDENVAVQTSLKTDTYLFARYIGVRLRRFSSIYCRNMAVLFIMYYYLSLFSVPLV